MQETVALQVTVSCGVYPNLSHSIPQFSHSFDIIVRSFTYLWPLALVGLGIKIILEKRVESA